MTFKDNPMLNHQFLYFHLREEMGNIYEKNWGGYGQENAFKQDDSYGIVASLGTRTVQDRDKDHKYIHS